MRIIKTRIAALTDRIEQKRSRIILLTQFDFPRCEGIDEKVEGEAVFLRHLIVVLRVQRSLERNELVDDGKALARALQPTRRKRKLIRVLLVIPVRKRALLTRRHDGRVRVRVSADGASAFPPKVRPRFEGTSEE